MKCNFSSVEVLPRSKFWKKWNRPKLLNQTEHFDDISHTHWYWQDLAQRIAKYHFACVEALPRSKLWESEKCPELVNNKEYFDKIFAYIFLMTRPSISDCKMTFVVGRGFAGVQILKKWNLALSLELSGIMSKNYARTRDCQMLLFICRGPNPEKKMWKWPYGCGTYYREVPRTVMYVLT